MKLADKKYKGYADDYVVFDLETTGFDADNNHIIEIGALKYINNVLVEEFDYLINPMESIPSVITNITGIDNEMVEGCPTIEEVLPKFIAFIGDLPLVAHNSPFDLGFIEANINRLNLPMINNQNIDTVWLARKNINTYNHKLETLKKYFNLEFDSHRSVADCMTTNYVYQYCKDKEKVLL